MDLVKFEILDTKTRETDRGYGIVWVYTLEFRFPFSGPVHVGPVSVHFRSLPPGWRV